jgi:hypothetical protein
VAKHDQHHRHPKLAKTHEKLSLQASKPNVNLEVNMGDGPATPSAGYSGWEEVPRVKRRAMVAFKGLPAFQQDVPILIDGFQDGQSIERQVEAVLSLGAAVIFTAEGPIYYSGAKFVFGEEPEFTEQIRENDGTLVRVRMVLKLMAKGPLEGAGAKRETPSESGKKFEPEYVVTAGADSLHKIAVLLYQEPSKWKELGEKNGITGAYTKLKVGRRLIL